jgi:heme exporter protein D
MIWNSLGDFLAMGGYALYVWGSVLAVALCLALELLALRLRRKAIDSQLASHKSGERA